MIKKTYETDRMLLQLAEPPLAKRVSEFYRRNQDFLRKSEPHREKSFYTEDFQRKALARDLKKARDLCAVQLWMFLKDSPDDGDAIGTVRLGGIVYGTLRSAYLAYKLDGSMTRQGYMHEALTRLIDIAFQDVGLHRLEANIMPCNGAAIRLVEKLGFRQEGLSPRYLNIDGVWEDHLRMALLYDEE